MKLNVKSILDAFKLIGYGLLLIADSAVTFASMFSVGHINWLKIVMAIVGVIILLVGAWVFLMGIRKKGTEKNIMIGAWLLSLVLLVSINWAFTGTILKTKSEKSSTEKTETVKQETTTDKLIKLSLHNIEVYSAKLEKLSQWQERERDSITKAMQFEKDTIKELNKKPDTLIVSKEAEDSMNVFEEMAAPFGGDTKLVSRLWWLLLFVVAQVLTVIAAPKADEDAPTRRKRTPRASKPEDLTESVWWYVWGHWTCIRAGRTPPHRLLPFHDFDVFIRARFREIPERVCTRIAQAAQRAGVIEGDEIRELNEEAARKKIMAAIDK